LDDGLFSAVHFEQRIASALPQFGQNLRPVVLSDPHLEQRIEHPIEPYGRSRMVDHAP
jgi:hypothetical protein